LRPELLRAKMDGVGSSGPQRPKCNKPRFSVKKKKPRMGARPNSANARHRDRILRIMDKDQRGIEGMVPLKPDQAIEPCVGRNDPCPCGSGKKHKRCCLAR
jgi:uncharacterized protein YecA (UPF0149 family)